MKVKVSGDHVFKFFELLHIEFQESYFEIFESVWFP